jgi:hypothetical protein
MSDAFFAMKPDGTLNIYAEDERLVWSELLADEVRFMVDGEEGAPVERLAALRDELRRALELVETVMNAGGQIPIPPLIERHA